MLATGDCEVARCFYYKKTPFFAKNVFLICFIEKKYYFCKHKQIFHN